MKEIAIMRGFFHTVQHDHMRRYITVPEVWGGVRDVP